jgi:hypothetical protein
MVSSACSQRIDDFVIDHNNKAGKCRDNFVGAPVAAQVCSNYRLQWNTAAQGTSFRSIVVANT